MSHDTYREWIELELDGALGPGEAAALAEHLEDCAECRSERDRSRELVQRLIASRVTVRSGFRDDVLAALGEPEWARPVSASWRLPAALAFVLAAVAAALWSRAGGLGSGGGAGALGALLDLVRVGWVAAIGLADATWNGLGRAIAAWLGQSPARWIFASLVVFGTATLAVRLLRRRPHPAAETRRG